MSGARPLVLLAWLAACAPDESPRTGIETRVFVDRSEARVGDPIGVTIEVETPPGFMVEAPSALPESPGFLSQSVETPAPRESARGLKHVVLWTLRARDTGEHFLPSLSLALVGPDGAMRPLPVAGLPLPVRSVRTELPEQRAYFDIRDPPPVERSRGALYLGGAVLAVVGLLAALVMRHRHDRAANAGPDPIALARRTVERLELAAAQRETRALAAHSQAALWAFVEGRFGVQAAAATPDELPERVDATLTEVLHLLEHARFEPSPEREPVASGSARARVFLQAFAGDVVDA